MTNVVLGTCLCTNGWNGKHCTLEGCPTALPTALPSALTAADAPPFLQYQHRHRGQMCLAHTLAARHSQPCYWKSKHASQPAR